MQELMERLFQKYGSWATVRTSAGEVRTAVFFRGIRSDAWRNVERVFTPLGEVPQGRYVCLLPADVKAEPEAEITLDGKTYLLRSIQPVAAFTDMAYQWCLCVEKGA